MKKLFFVLALLASTALALAQTGTPKSKSTLSTEINTNFPNNTTGVITPQLLRQTTQDMVASWQQYLSVNAQSGTTYTVLAADYGHLVTFSNSAATAVTLPAASTLNPFNVYVLNKGTGTVTITPASGTINGQASLTVGTNQGFHLVSDSANWQLAKAGISVSGVLTNGHCAGFDALGNIVDEGGPCTTGGGGGTVTAGSTNQLAYYATNGTAVSGLANAGTSGKCLTSIASGTSVWGTCNLVDVVAVCGADASGVADSAAAINSCLTTYNGVYIPKGTFKISNPIQITTNNQKIIGAGIFMTTLTADSANKNIIQNTGNFINMEIGEFTCQRSVSPATAPGSCIGNTGLATTQMGLAYIHDVFAYDQYNGFDLGETNEGLAFHLRAENSWNDGFFFGADGVNPQQWDLLKVFASRSNNDGFEFSITNAGSPTGNWNQIFAFSSGKHGLEMRSDNPATHIWSNMFMSNSGFSGSGNENVLMTGGVSGVWNAGLCENAGQSGMGRGGLIAGDGISPCISVKTSQTIDFSHLSIGSSQGAAFQSDGTNFMLGLEAFQIGANGLNGTSAGILLLGSGFGETDFVSAIMENDSNSVVGISTTIANVNVLNSNFRSGCSLASGNRKSINFGTGC